MANNSQTHRRVKTVSICVRLSRRIVKVCEVQTHNIEIGNKNKRIESFRLATSTYHQSQPPHHHLMFDVICVRWSAMECNCLAQLLHIPIRYISIYTYNSLKGKWIFHLFCAHFGVREAHSNIMLATNAMSRATNNSIGIIWTNSRVKSCPFLLLTVCCVCSCPLMRH